MERQKAVWVRVSRQEPCPICAKPDYCSRTADGAVAKCMRIESVKPAPKGGWIHKLSDGTLPVIVNKPKAAPKRLPEEWWADSEKMFMHAKAEATRDKLAAQLGVSADSLRRLRVGWSADYAGEFASFPIRNVCGFVTGITRRYLHNGSKKTMQGSRGGLYYCDGWREFKGPIFLPEGASDVAALLTMELCAIGRWSNVGGIEDIAQMLRNEKRPVFVIGERDEKPERKGEVSTCPKECQGCAYCFPGKYGAEHTAACLAKLLKRKVRWVFAPDGAKDARDWLKVNGPDGGRFLNRLWRKTITN